MGENLHKERIEKYYKERLEKIYYSTERTYYLKLPINSKTYFSDVNSTSDYMCIHSQTGLEP